MWFHEVTEFFERIERSSGHIGEQMAIQAISAAMRQSVVHVRQRYRKAGDLGTVAEQILPATSDTTLKVAGVYR